MENKTKAMIALIVAVMGISALFFYASSIKPVSMAIGDIRVADEGKLVSAEGVVSAPRKGEGFYSFDLVDVNTGDMVKVFLDFSLKDDLKAALISGAKAKVVGEITIYRERPELKVKEGSSLRITAPPQANGVRLGVIIGNKAVFEDMMVVVHGTVDRASFSWGDANITLQDGQFQASCRVYGFVAQVPFEEGSRISIFGRVWFDETGMIHISANGWQSVTVDN